MRAEILTVTSSANERTGVVRHKMAHPAAKICRASITDASFLRYVERVAGGSRKRTTKGSRKAREFEFSREPPIEIKIGVPIRVDWHLFAVEKTIIAVCCHDVDHRHTRSYLL